MKSAKLAVFAICIFASSSSLKAQYLGDQRLWPCWPRNPYHGGSGTMCHASADGVTIKASLLL